MIEICRKQLGFVALAIAVLGSAVMYWNHRSRAIGDPTRCKDLETHFVRLAGKPEKTKGAEFESLAYSIRERCGSRFSKTYARCLLKAGSMAQVRESKP